MSYELIITEKPSAAKKIAESLSNSKPIRKAKNGVSYYEITHGNKDIVVACAVGHLYTLEEKEKGKNGWTYPVFDIKWIPSYTKKGSEYTKKYLDVLSSLAKNAN